jgi:hypothetical protein
VDRYEGAQSRRSAPGEFGPFLTRALAVQVKRTNAIIKLTADGTILGTLNYPRGDNRVGELGKYFKNR